MSNINRVIESINKLHGGEREQAAKHQSYTAWLLRRRAAEDGREPSILLKKDDK